ncbi:MAG: hypothetical protein SV186_01125 [Candidatus Nanohaloarchaea archaeon]|nr:hypothetical protein [Candidatus Nanohaloarchaea archaeon]
MTLGDLLHEELYQPDNLDVHLVGVSEYRNENDDFFDGLIDELEANADITPHRVAAEEYQRDDVEQLDLFEHDYPDSSLLVVPDTYGFGRGGASAAERYKAFIDLHDQGLDGVLHLDVDDDLDRAPEADEQDYGAEALADDLVLAYQRDEGRVYDPTVIETDDDTMLLSKLY